MPVKLSAQTLDIDSLGNINAACKLTDILHRETVYRPRGLFNLAKVKMLHACTSISKCMTTKYATGIIKQ